MSLQVRFKFVLYNCPIVQQIFSNNLKNVSKIIIFRRKQNTSSKMPVSKSAAGISIHDYEYLCLTCLILYGLKHFTVPWRVSIGIYVSSTYRFVHSYVMRFSSLRQTVLNKQVAYGNYMRPPLCLFCFTLFFSKISVSKDRGKISGSADRAKYSALRIVTQDVYVGGMFRNKITVASASSWYYK